MEYLAKHKKLYMCFVDLEESFDRVPNIVVELPIRQKGIPEAVMNVYKYAMTKVKVGRHLSKELDVNCGVH